MSQLTLIKPIDLWSVCAILPPISSDPPLGGIMITLDNYDDLFVKEIFIDEGVIKRNGWYDFPNVVDVDTATIYENDVARFVLRRDHYRIKDTDDINTIVKKAHPIKWHRFFASQIDFFELQGVIFSRHSQSDRIVPPLERVFYSQELVPPTNITVVIIGQDPYPQPNFATGLAFSVNSSVRYLPTAVTKILEELEREFPPGNPIVNKNGIVVGKPFVRPGHGDLTKWTRQGVLLMNLTNTTIEGTTNAHADRWAGYADTKIRYICKNNKKIVFMLWGRQAQTIKSAIGGNHLILEASHPSASNYGTTDRFIGCGHFRQANEFRIAKDLPIIDWTL